MSVSVTVTFFGEDLGKRPNRDLAEHIVKVVEAELVKVGGALDWTTEEKHEARAFLGDEPWRTTSHHKVDAVGHFDADPPADPPTP